MKTQIRAWFGGGEQVDPRAYWPTNLSQIKELEVQ